MAEKQTERNQEMWKLRHVKGWTLDEIGTKYGISRERVRQIIGNTGRDFLTMWTRQKIESGFTLPSTFESLWDLRGSVREWRKEWAKHRHTAKGGLARLGQIFEELASFILAENKIPNKLMTYRCPYDIQTESGLRIDVKVSHMNVQKLKSQMVTHPTYQLPEMKSGKDCDFFFVFIPDVDEPSGYTYFIIPAHEFHHMQIGSRPRIPWKPLSQKPSKWHKYNKRINLLKQKSAT